MTHLNLSEWGLRHRSMIAYLIIVMMVGGVFSYFKLGRAEDPDFTFKAMVVRTLWPGATAQEVEQQVTERIEKKLQEVPWADVIRSNSKSGESLVFIILKDYTPKKEVPEAWYQVRKKIGDIRHTFPAGIQGPFINDEFGDTFINLFALTGDGFDLARLRQEADRVARERDRLPEQLREPLGDRFEAVLRVGCAVGAPQVRARDDAGALVDEVVQRGKSRPDTAIVRDDALFERDVDVNTDDDALTGQRTQRIEGTQSHE
jgi:hypothetical protein